MESAKHVSNVFNIDTDLAARSYPTALYEVPAAPLSTPFPSSNHSYNCLLHKLKHCNFIYFASDSLPQNVASTLSQSVTLPVTQSARQWQRLLIKCVPDSVAEYELLLGARSSTQLDSTSSRVARLRRLRLKFKYISQMHCHIYLAKLNTCLTARTILLYSTTYLNWNSAAQLMR